VAKGAASQFYICAPQFYIYGGGVEMKIFARLTVLAGFIFPLGSAIAQDATEIVQTSLGAVQGEVVDGVENFYGIPFAAPPVGELRWAPPQAAKRWEGVRPATDFAPSCSQRDGLDAPRSENEDCLYLNVQRPAGTAANANLPVLVYIHGGGFFNGSANVENLEKLVRDNNIIGIAINYRLGSLGFLAHPALTAAAGESGNYAFMDQQAALRWVQENAASFGGDPKAVTIAGESAGGNSVCVQMVTPGSKGLFSKVILQSSRCGGSPPVGKAEQTGEKLAAELNCTGTNDEILACLRAKPVAELLAAKTVTTERATGTAFLPTDPLVALQNGDFTKVPVLVGSQSDEGRSMIIDWRKKHIPEYDRDGYIKYVRDRFGEDADAVLNVWPWPSDATRYTGTYLVASLRYANTATGLGQCATNDMTNVFAKHAPTFAYLFSHQSGPGWFPVEGYVWGASHATDLAYLMPKRPSPGVNSNEFGPAERQISDEMVRYWGAFIKNGNPAVEGQVAWPAYTAGSGPILSIRGPADAVPIPMAALRSSYNCEFSAYLATK
jgi:para-nitrobenzyl esterase